MSLFKKNRRTKYLTIIHYIRLEISIKVENLKWHILAVPKYMCQKRWLRSLGISQELIGVKRQKHFIPSHAVRVRIARNWKRGYALTITTINLIMEFSKNGSHKQNFPSLKFLNLSRTTKRKHLLIQMLPCHKTDLKSQRKCKKRKRRNLTKRKACISQLNQEETSLCSQS